MKILLCQATPLGKVEIARAADASFHVLWDGRSIARAPTLPGALKAAATKPAEIPPGLDASEWQVSEEPDSWYMSDTA